MPLQRGLGWNRENENHAKLVATQVRFDRSHFCAYRVPDEIDARPDQVVKDQGQLSECHGFSRSSLEERLNFVQTKSKVSLSAAYAALTNQREDGSLGQGDVGATISASATAAAKDGICLESTFPTPAEYTDKIPAAADAEGKLHLVASHSVISDYQTAIQYLGTAGVIQIGIPVGQQFQNCSGPLTTRAVQADARNPEGGHALAVIGYLKPSTIGVANGDGRAWLVGQNSWSPSWGSEGFFFIQPAAFDYLCRLISHGEVEIVGMSTLAAFDDPTQALDWDYT